MVGLSYGDKSVLSYTRHDATFPGIQRHSPNKPSLSLKMPVYLGQSRTSEGERGNVYLFALCRTDDVCTHQITTPRKRRKWPRGTRWSEGPAEKEQRKLVGGGKTENGGESDRPVKLTLSSQK